MASKSVAVLDIRSSEVAVFVGERGINHTFVFKASRTEPYGGYQDGEFYDIEDLSRAVTRAISAVEQICGEKVKTLFVGVPGEFTKVVPKEQVLGFPKKLKIGAKELDELFSSGRENIKGYRFIRVTSMIYTTADDRRVANPIGLHSTGLSGILSYFYATEYFVKTMEQIFSKSKTALRYLPTQFAMAAYLISPELRDEYALFLDVGYLSSTVCVILGNGVLAQRTFWSGKGQIVVRLMQRFNLSFDAATALLARANLYLKKDAKPREFVFGGVSYDIPSEDFIDEVKAGLDELCEAVGDFLDDCTDDLDVKPLYVTGEGLDGIRGALEHISKRISCVCELLVPNLPYYNKPAMSSRVALMDMASEDNRTSGSLYRLLNFFGG